MRWIVARSLVLTLLLLAGMSPRICGEAADFPSMADLAAKMNADQPKMIQLAVFAEGKRMMMRYVFPKDGVVSQSSFSNTNEHSTLIITEKYKVHAAGKGGFVINFHRVVDDNGTKSVSNVELPVWHGEPAATQRVHLNDGCTVVAYLEK